MKTPRFVYSFTQLLCRGAVLLFYRVEIRGQNNIPTDHPVILASNHQSNLDPPLIAAFFPRELVFVAKEQLFRSFWLATVLRYFNALPISRGGVDLKAIRRIRESLALDRDLLVFPEGTRHPNNRLGKPRAGLGMIAAHSKTDVLPVLIRGSFQRPRFLFGRPSLLLEFCPVVHATTFPEVDESQLKSGKDRAEHYGAITEQIFEHIRKAMTSAQSLS
jgi:1-acyl-sn-glycerol-3-phosphate acyltransferase